jgi:hypothetical protein
MRTLCVVGTKTVLLRKAGMSVKEAVSRTKASFCVLNGYLDSLKQQTDPWDVPVQ